MRVWYCVTRDSIRLSPVRRLKRMCRAATMKLAASRLISHSHGPSATSSKSFRSNTSWRSGVANPPKFIRCASPQMGITKPVFDILPRSLACRIALPLKNVKGDAIIRPYLSGTSRSTRPLLFCSSSSIGSRSIVPIRACAERAMCSRHALPAAIRDAVLFSAAIYAPHVTHRTHIVLRERPVRITTSLQPAAYFLLYWSAVACHQYGSRFNKFGVYAVADLYALERNVGSRLQCFCFIRAADRYGPLRMVDLLNRCQHLHSTRGRSGPAGFGDGRGLVDPLANTVRRDLGGADQDGVLVADMDNIADLQLADVAHFRIHGDIDDSPALSLQRDAIRRSVDAHHTCLDFGGGGGTHSARTGGRGCIL